MLLKRNLLESVTIISCSGTVIGILLNYVTNISPLSGIWFPLYVLVLFFVSLACSFRLIQWSLELNKPLKYDVEGLVKDYPYLGFLADVLPRIPLKDTAECKEYDTNDLSVISTVLERRLVSSWYVPYVSQEIGFPFACKQLLDQMIGKTFQICNKIETKDIYIDICTVLITHLKEYKKAIKRHEKAPQSSIESLYKKSHPISNLEKKYTSGDHCTNLLRVILKELVPWELWDTPHSELLIRILSKKLDNFIVHTLTDPVWLNDKLMTILKGKTGDIDSHKPEPVKEEIQPDIGIEETTEESQELDRKITNILNEPATPKSEMKTIESALSSLVTKTTAPILQRPIKDREIAKTIEDQIEVQEVTIGSDPVDINSSPVLRQRRGRQGRNKVKIYDRVIEGSVKTWDNQSDLQCISLGQDLLASLDGEITLSRLWGQDPQEDGKQSRFWFGEDDADLEIDSKEPSPVKKEMSPKPADAILKDIQSTVHQAKTKIGDLQVPLHVPVHVNDEAAGMMEGLLDFGIAGFKKGLRFTGLSDDSQEKSPSHKEKSPPPESKNKITEQKEVITSTSIHKEENGNSVPPLLKQQRVSSQDSVASLPKPILSGPKGEFPPLVPLSDSPEPEYEEAADLSTSIAKLRCLLQQRAESGNTNSNSSNTSRSDDIWWEGAEETRGRANTHHSNRPVDTATLADEYDINAERNSSPGQTSNNMQRLDKLFQRTVTGVFNSIKTAVGAEGEGEREREGEGGPTTLHDWTYVCTCIELSVGGAVARLVGSRRAVCGVDAALDSLQHLTPPNEPQPTLAPEDFEEWCSLYGVAWCAGCEVCGAAGLALWRHHLLYRLTTILFADLAESFITVYLSELSAWLRRQVFAVFEQMADQQDSKEKELLREFNLEETCAALVERVPGLAVFGEESVSDAVRLTVNSFSHAALNKDLTFRLLDLFSLHFKQAAGIRNPSFDNN